MLRHSYAQKVLIYTNRYAECTAVSGDVYIMVLEFHF